MAARRTAPGEFAQAAGARVIEPAAATAGPARREREAADPGSRSSSSSTATGRPCGPDQRRLPARCTAGAQDLVLASRTLCQREPAEQCSGTRCIAVPARWTRHRPALRCTITDMCALRPSTARAPGLCLRETTYGWNIEMQLQAARAGLRVLEVPMPYRDGSEAHRRSPVRGPGRCGPRRASARPTCASPPVRRRAREDRRGARRGRLD